MRFRQQVDFGEALGLHPEIVNIAVDNILEGIVIIVTGVVFDVELNPTGRI